MSEIYLTENISVHTEPPTDSSFQFFFSVPLFNLNQRGLVNFF